MSFKSPWCYSPKSLFGFKASYVGFVGRGVNTKVDLLSFMTNLSRKFPALLVKSNAQVRRGCVVGSRSRFDVSVVLPSVHSSQIGSTTVQAVAIQMITNSQITGPHPEHGSVKRNRDANSMMKENVRRVVRLCRGNERPLKGGQLEILIIDYRKESARKWELDHA